MTYDASSDSCYIAVYKGKKSNYPNYSLFSFDATQIPSFSLLEGFDKSEKQWTIRLGELGNRDEKAGFADGIFHGEALAFSLPAITIFTFLKTIGTKMGKNVVLFAYTNGQAIA
ncbi:MAG: hypothetical protein L6V92_12450 [Phocaeicola vulgatus]|nr:MAG: hypothetical protein L6V92_12450 [Phocaeicola vulgatus]